jgi:hypothetical protein
MVTGRAATALKYQRQCIEKGEQNLAVLARHCRKSSRIHYCRVFLGRNIKCGCRRGGSRLSAFAAPTDAHPILHLLRNPVIAHDRPSVTQAAAFPLDDKAPQRLARSGDQFPTRLVGDLEVAVVLTQSGKRSFEGAAGAPECGGLFLRYFIVEGVCD